MRPTTRVAALTSSRDDPSSRFRMRQLFVPLSRRGIDVVEYRPWISKYARAPLQWTGLGLASRFRAAVGARRCDVTWLNRELVRGRRTIERWMGDCRILDVDDAVWLQGRNDFARRIAAECRGVIAGNARIADHFRGTAAVVWTVPTAVDTDVWVPGGKPSGVFRIGWSGTRWNLPYLAAIEEPLARFLEDHEDAELHVVCDARPVLRLLPPGRVRFARWSPQNEIAALQDTDVGLMPLPDDEWARAKCATKMLCAMSVGLPVVVSPVGVAAEILGLGSVGLAAKTAEDWYEALASLHRDRDTAGAMGRAGREVVVRHFSAEKAADILAEIFREVART